ncbi:MAG TPA: protein-L-isoaspartate(D-aspartate) O-methyltransferase [Desulfuromonadales bacterium]|nr:protein-L-isoaspartate(D-aspartate) O-methyltransferase [Desulfuromonadales bacterium]
MLLLVSALLLIFLSPCAALAAEEPAEFRQAREQMVRTQLERRDISDPATLQAMRRVPRHHFVAESLAHEAYADRPLPIGYGQTISQPFMVGYMTEIVAPGPGRRILEVGTGSGYQAAVLAATGAEVYSIEIIPQLAESAAERLRRLGFETVRVRAGDGYFGWAEHAPFDAIVVTAAAEFIPPPLLAQLKDGGRMVIPVGTPFFVQTLMLIEKRGSEITTRSLMPVRFVPFRRAE